jgi:hypothetical protein
VATPLTLTLSPKGRGDQSSKAALEDDYPSPQPFAVHDNGVSQTRLPPRGEESVVELRLADFLSPPGERIKVRGTVGKP